MTRTRDGITSAEPWTSRDSTRVTGVQPLECLGGLAARGGRRAQPREEVITDTQRVGHCRQSWVHRAGGGEEARVDDVEVVHVVRFAVEVERRAPGIGAEAHGAALVRDAGDGDLLAEHRPPRDALLMAAERTEEI